MYTVKAALEEASATIGRVDAQALITHFLGVDRAYLITNAMRVLTESEDARIDMAVAQRALGFPVAYLTGTREFYSRAFTVTPDVLIPRPETETLVEAALKTGNRPRFSALDLGTGSGVIAITLALECPQAKVTASDSSANALEVARANARALGAEVEFVRGEWYAAVKGRRFDLIVSNPPYIAANDPHLAEGDLRHEPAQALCDGSADGLDSIRAIVAGARDHLNRGGRVLLEHGYDQASAVAAILAAAGFADLTSLPDLAGIPRVAGGKLPA
jgi:release factor glutamine methyltransferase